MAERLLTDLILDEISLVDDPGNQHAFVSIVKRRLTSDEDETVALYRAAVERGVNEALPRVIGDFVDRMVAKARSGAIPLNPDAAAPAASSILEALMDIDQLASALEAAEAKFQEIDKANKTLSEQNAKLAADLESVTKSLKDKDDEIAKIKASGKDDPEEVLKGLPEPVRKMIEERDAKAAKAIEEVTKLREERETEDAVSKARGIGFGDPAAVGPMLLRVAKGMATAEDAKLIEQLLSRAATVEKQSPLFRASGTNAAGESDEHAILLSKAQEIRKSNPGMTEAQAYDRAVMENPDVYNAFVSKRRASAH